MSDERKVWQPEYGIYREAVGSPCWSCGHVMDAASEMTGRRKPEAEDYALCFNCGEMSVYTGLGLQIREPTPEEAAEFAESGGAQLQADVRRFRAERGPL